MSEKRYYWIKLKENFFDLETIDWLVSQKNGCEYIVLYQKLCLLTANKGGKLVSSVGEMIIPYDTQKIARDTKFSVDTVIVAMELFKKIGLVYEETDGILQIPAVVEMVGSETAGAERVRKHRALHCNNNVTNNVTIDNRYKILDNRDNRKDINYKQIKDLYNEICVSFPRLTVLSDKRKQTIKARLNSYSFEQIKEVFEKAETSDFLKGKNNRDWQANFDWLMKDSNFAKVLDGNYDKKQKGTEETKSFGNYNKQKFSDRINSDYE